MDIDPTIQCDCSECRQHGGPNKTILNLRVVNFFLQYIYAAYALVKAKSWKSFGVTFGALAFFFPLRYLVCARCQNYGKNCYSLYLGKVTSKLMPKVENKEINNLSIFLEISTLYLMFMGPVFGLLRRFKLLIPYTWLMGGTVGAQFLHACRHCGLYAKEGTWQARCPAGKVAGVIFGALENQK